MNYKLYSFGHSLLALIYIAAVAWFLNNAQHLFPNVPEYLAAVTMIMLFVLSATIVGTLVLGRPILMYLDGKKKEAMQFFAYTVGWLTLFFVIIVINIITR